MTQSVVASNGIEPVLIPCRLSVCANLTSSGVNNLVPSIVLEGVVALTAEFATKASTSDRLSFCPRSTAIPLCITQSLVNQLSVLFLAYVLITLVGTVCPTYIRTPCHVSLTLLTSLGCNHHNTIGTTSTIQSARRSILQHGHRLNIWRVQWCQTTIVRNTINHIKRCAWSIDRTETTYADTRRRTRLTRTRSHLNTSHITFQSLRYTRHRTKFYVLCTNALSRTREWRLLLCAISHNDDFIQSLVVRSQQDAHVWTSAYLQRFHTNISNTQSLLTCRHRQWELSTGICHSTCTGSNNQDRCTHYGLSVILRHNGTADFCLSQYSSYQKE